MEADVRELVRDALVAESRARAMACRTCAMPMLRARAGWGSLSHFRSPPPRSDLGEGDRAAGLALTIQIVAKRSPADGRPRDHLVAKGVARENGRRRVKTIVAVQDSARRVL